jgi:hypothetical protein
VFATQGGGLVREVAPNKYIFVEDSGIPGCGVGDYKPDEWDIIPANDQAVELLAEEYYSPTDTLAEILEGMHD